jgi:hypothetical protein
LKYQGGERDLKRALTGIVAASMVLGTMVPAAFAATTDTLTPGGGKSISLDGSTLYTGVQVGNANDAGTVTTYFPIWYLMQALSKGGYVNTYDPKTATWDISMPGVDASKISVEGGVGSGNAAISINGTVVKRFNAKWTKDLAGGKNASVTTYFPLYYLEKVLEAAGFQNAWDGNNFSFKSYVAPPVNASFVSATSNNLKQVVVNFSAPLDKATAEDESNYTLSDANKNALPWTFKSAVLSDDGKSVTLTLADAYTFSQQTQYLLSFNDVKDAAGNVLSQDYAPFTPIDNTLPTVANAEALGNKTIRITFSEPVQLPSISNFQIDGVQAVGYVTASSSNTVMLRLYSPLSDGTHKLTVSGVQDYAGFKSLSQDVSVNTVADTTPPTIAAVKSATFERVTLQFSEPVDPATVNASDVYWMQGTTKNFAGSVTQLSDDTYAFDFSNDKITYTTDLYVVGVKDYSGNTIADGSKIQVTPVIDQTRPNVINATIDSTATVITVKFDKAVDASSVKASDFVITDADGKEVSKLKTVATSGNVVTVTLSQALTQGSSYTLKIDGITDTTTLHNAMLPYTKTLTIGDTTGPSVSSVVYSNASGANSIAVTFNEKVAVSGDGSALDTSHYLYAPTAGTWKALPAGTSIALAADGKTVLINIPSSSGVNVGSIEGIRVQLVKDLSGNYMQNLTADFTKTAGNYGVASHPVVSGSVKADSNTEIKVPFNLSLLANTVTASDFTVKAGTTVIPVISAHLDADDSKVVDLELSNAYALNDDATYGTSGTPVTVAISSNASTSTAQGMNLASNAGVTVNDGISGTVASVAQGDTAGKVINVAFNEVLANFNDSTGVKESTDFVVIDEDGNTLVPGTDYTVKRSVANNKVAEIDLAAPHSGILSVEIKNPRFLKDAAGNVVAAADAQDVVLSIDTTAPTAVVGTNHSATQLDVNFSEAASTVTIDDSSIASGDTVTLSFDATNAPTTATFDIDNTNGGAVANDTITFTVTDLAGNSTQYVATFNGTTWSLAKQ